MAEFIEFEAREEEDGDFTGADDELNEEEILDFLDDDNVYDDEGLPPNPYMIEPVKYPRGLERVSR